MGFDGLKFKQPIHRQHKSFVENNLHKTSPVAPQGDPHLVDGGSHIKWGSTSSQSAKTFFEDMSGSINMDAILELLKKRKQLFVKHLQDVQESSSRSVCSHLTIPKQSAPEKYQAIKIKTFREVLQKNITLALIRHMRIPFRHDLLSLQVLRIAPSHQNLAGMRKILQDL